MKAENRQEFSYTRTIEHEKYSMAILLFEVLMLGKAPYESRNTDNEDVIQAIMSGTFPYPYKGDEEEENNNARVLAPVGRWRQIWSHLTYLVKTGFYETFTGKGRLSAAEWENTLREYVRQIEIGHSSDDLVPTGYKDTSDRGGGEMVDLICTFPGCKAHFNMGREVYLRRRERGEPDRCPVHQDIRKNFSRRMVEQPCGVCGTVFQLTALEWTDRSQAGKALLCPSCVNETVICSGCRKTYTEKRDKVTELRKKGTPLLCPECLPTVVCEECGDKFRTNREKVESLRRSGRQVLCKSCLDKMLAARNAE